MENKEIKKKKADETLKAHESNVEGIGKTVADAPAAVILKDDGFWVGERRFNTFNKALTYLQTL
ncbi:MAG: hypothetical protein LBT04_02085 [Prevotellaceae bacterium]|jgi:hypothetical protein|nr:hypothetical protein [Prevotellaceae bacterium]